MFYGRLLPVDDAQQVVGYLDELRGTTLELTYIFCNNDGALGDVGQTVQSDLYEVWVVVDHERAAGKRGRADAADQHQVRENFTQAGEVGNAVHD